MVNNNNKTLTAFLGVGFVAPARHCTTCNKPFNTLMKRVDHKMPSDCDKELKAAKNRQTFKERKVKGSAIRR